MKEKRTRQIFFGIALLAIIFFAGQSLGQNIWLKPINQLAEEQQAILAIRQAKLSVVTIIGKGKQAIPPAGGFNLIPDEPLVTVEGTGFVWDANGIIVSNSHVVATENLAYSVKLLDGRIYPAKILGTDKVADIAVLKIEAQNLTAAKLGNSDSLDPGQSVFAIGNSLGRYQNTVTRGVISGLGRAVEVGNTNNPQPRLQNLIQTDAAINRGNSGGPLIDLAGQVVGMNTVVDIEGQSLGFAISINTIKTAVPQLRDLGKMSRPRTGISFRTVDDVLRIGKNWPADFNGALVVAVAEDGPAKTAGILPGDVIIEINHQPLNEDNQLDTVISQKFQAGDQILVSLLRNGERIDLPLILQEFK